MRDSFEIINKESGYTFESILRFFSTIFSTDFLSKNSWRLIYLFQHDFTVL